MPCGTLRCASKAEVRERLAPPEDVLSVSYAAAAAAYLAASPPSSLSGWVAAAIRFHAARTSSSGSSARAGSASRRERVVRHQRALLTEGLVEYLADVSERDHRPRHRP